MAGATQVSLKGAAALLASEGLVLGGYKDSVGVWTIGVGHTAAAGAPNPQDYANKKMSKRDAMLLFLTTDLPRYTADVLRLVKRPLAQHELDALVHFNYNVGPSNFKKSNVLRAVNAGDQMGAANGFLGWVKPPELAGRRQVERGIFLGQYPAHPMISVYPGGQGGGLGKAKAESAASLIALVSGPAEPSPEVISPKPPVFAPPVAGDDPGPVPVAIPPVGPADESPALSPDIAYRRRVEAVQRDLFRVGLKPGEIDGIVGKNTIGAMAAFRAAFRLTGVANQIDAELEAKLRETPDNHFKPAPERAAATAEQAAEKSGTVEKVSFSARIRRRFNDILAALGIGGVVDSQTDAFGFFSGRWSSITSKLAMVPWYVWVIIFLAGYIAYREYARRTTEAVVVQAFKTGDIIGGDKQPQPPAT
jgi:lysozyme